MNFAEKYRQKVAKSTREFLKRSSKNKEELAKLEAEERRKRAEWEKRKNAINEQMTGCEEELVGNFGSLVMASGFADEYREDFELLSGILHYAMAQMKENPEMEGIFRASSRKRKKAKADAENVSKIEGVEVVEADRPPELEAES